ncbi:hypothetical protein BV20DRAFT_326412 [Pilatotrama ljubarskyi]|nr:hypothetical protein BV20DRAFT_326412 [Pilatotrama ljubarskyi]
MLASRASARVFRLFLDILNPGLESVGTAARFSLYRIESERGLRNACALSCIMNVERLIAHLVYMHSFSRTSISRRTGPELGNTPCPRLAHDVRPVCFRRCSQLSADADFEFEWLRAMRCRTVSRSAIQYRTALGSVQPNLVEDHRDWRDHARPPLWFGVRGSPRARPEDVPYGCNLPREGPTYSSDFLALAAPGVVSDLAASCGAVRQCYATLPTYDAVIVMPVSVWIDVASTHRALPNDLSSDHRILRDGL